jgi:hypothetical protein
MPALMMKHATIFIEVTEWLQERTGNDPQRVLSTILSYLVERGFRSFEQELGALLQDFVGFYVDQKNVSRSENSIMVSRGRYRASPMVFSSLLRKDGSYVFVDVEMLSRDGEVYVELDVFAPSDQELNHIKTALVDDVMKCFGLTGSVEQLVKSELRSSGSLTESLVQKLTLSSPLTNALFQRLKEKIDRSILVELKKRGSILERDLAEFPLAGVSADRIKSTLDYFSGADYALVDRKHAIVCLETQEIIFLLRERSDLSQAKNLECPKCSKPIGDEQVYAYYERTDKLKELLDGNRWMPLLVRDALVSAGVPENDVLVEVKYGEDEIDVLAFYRGRTFVIEVKDRSISINDAYKLSAKTSRLESIMIKVIHGGATQQAIILEGDLDFPVSRRSSGSLFTPIAVSTQDIGKDARNLLVETKEVAKTLEHCEGKLDGFFAEMIDDINTFDLRRRLIELSAFDTPDSVSNLAGVQVETALAKWQEEA